ncbi:HutD/Ves family protein [Wohlfahrtiimonas larvae]|uniref:HutD-family protein n=1 Tax=Wohlfahrtiimonas larvae TaxID=1157986 RepID=A0ABP9MK12_9GAMM|nr:HutD family protein [Wohlfahrtiimonas larvae]
MEKITFKNLAEMPWKNGQGTTRQIAIHPKDADISNFQWRISAATVNAIGPFSNFDHVTRSLALLTGESITLDIEGKVVPLHRNGQPVSFSGSVPTAMIECPTPALDFGVMTNDHFVQHSLNQSHFADGEIYHRTSPITLILAQSPCSINHTKLDTFDAILLSASDPNYVTIQVSTKITSLLITEISEY